MTKRTIAVVAVLAGLGGAAYVAYDRGWMQPAEVKLGAAHAAPVLPATPVPVVPVVKRTIPVMLDYSARAESIRNLTLQAKVSSYLVEQGAGDGADVKAGDLLYRLDPRDFQAALDQAKAQVERDTASLAYLRSNLNRGTELAKSGYLAKDSFDQRSSNVEQTEASLGADRAAVRTAELNLAYSEIHAPFPGRLGRNQAPLGTLVGAGTTVLNTLVELDPIYVAFNPSETDLPALQKARSAGPVGADILVPGEAAPSHHGTLTFLDNVVDRATGTIIARATIANADFSLLPGQYVRARLHLRDEADALLVPQTALGSNQFGKYVYVVGPDDKAEMHPVTLGASDGDLVAVLKGVAEGDRIITGNLQKIGPGSPVKPLPPSGAGS
jgi:multidrug efflux system membrane fusion protein